MLGALPVVLLLTASLAPLVLLTLPTSLPVPGRCPHYKTWRAGRPAAVLRHTDCSVHAVSPLVIPGTSHPPRYQHGWQGI